MKEVYIYLLVCKEKKMTEKSGILAYTAKRIFN
jgi:hypothetical protein